ncbi:MAG: hypothetical protein HYX68_17920 [Planctomycetes bacterium]|nr:hypothetical protein [Planctomycetota bacterium]
MKKFFASGMLAICLIALSQQQASAWINTRFGVGLNWQWQSGGNNLLWGAYRGAQPPGPEAFGGQHGHFHGYSMSEFPVEQSQGVYPMPTPAPAYQYPSASPAPFQFATYPRPVYYYPAPTYYYYSR